MPRQAAKESQVYASLKRDPESVIPKLLLPMTPRYALEPLSGGRNFNFGSEAAERMQSDCPELSDELCSVRNPLSGWSVPTGLGAALPAPLGPGFSLQKFQQKALKQTKQKKSKSAEFLMVKEAREATEGTGNPAFNMSSPDLSAHQTSEKKVIRHDMLDRTLAAHQQKFRLLASAEPKGNEYSRNYFDPPTDEEINPRQYGMEVSGEVRLMAEAEKAESGVDNTAGLSEKETEKNVCASRGDEAKSSSVSSQGSVSNKIGPCPMDCDLNLSKEDHGLVESNLVVKAGFEVQGILKQLTFVKSRVVTTLMELNVMSYLFALFQMHLVFDVVIDDLQFCDPINTSLLAPILFSPIYLISFHSVKEKSTAWKTVEIEDYSQNTSYLEELEKHRFSVCCSSVADSTGSGEFFKHLYFVLASCLSELQFAQWQSQGFWYIILLMASLWFLRLYLHYLSQWLFLQAISIPVTKLHNDSWILDAFQRIHSEETKFFIPYDLEISNQELRYIVKRSEQWRGLNGERRKKRSTLEWASEAHRSSRMLGRVGKLGQSCIVGQWSVNLEIRSSSVTGKENN
ncbi:LOW QUALITY PROTEIN: uncharacterized protein [Kogia breviceps]|uniref:LOW QUALITY PROTEIN: uncharacterized protein n=1 Tax=Kogia breviceps TaxID=27615 RepID=UPI0034D38C74